MSGQTPPDVTSARGPDRPRRRVRPDGPPLRGPRRARAVGRGDSDRAQTTTDYAIGAGIFLLAIAFTFAFVPGILDPFTGGAGQDRTVVADRVATELAAGGLGDPADPYALDTTCTLAFFEQVNEDVDAPTDCNYETDGAGSVAAALGIDSLDSVQVTIERGDDGDGTGTEVVCRDETNGIDDCNDEDPELEELAAGTAPPDRSSVVTAQRSVRVDGAQYTLFVRVW